MTHAIFFQIPSHNETRWDLNVFFNDGTAKPGSFSHARAGHQDAIFNRGAAFDPNTGGEHRPRDKGVATQARHRRSSVSVIPSAVSVQIERRIWTRKIHACRVVAVDGPDIA